MIKDRKKPEKHLRICVKCAKIDSGLAENLLQDYNKARNFSAGRGRNA